MKISILLVLIIIIFIIVIYIINLERIPVSRIVSESKLISNFDEYIPILNSVHNKFALINIKATSDNYEAEKNFFPIDKDYYYNAEKQGLQDFLDICKTLWKLPLNNKQLPSQGWTDFCFEKINLNSIGDYYDIHRLSQSYCKNCNTLKKKNNCKKKKINLKTIPENFEEYIQVRCQNIDIKKMRAGIKYCNNFDAFTIKSKNLKTIKVCEAVWNEIGDSYELFLRNKLLTVIKDSISSYIQNSNPYDLHILTKLQFPKIFRNSNHLKYANEGNENSNIYNKVITFLNTNLDYQYQQLKSSTINLLKSMQGNNLFRDLLDQFIVQYNNFGSEDKDRYRRYMTYICMTVNDKDKKQCAINKIITSKITA